MYSANMAPLATFSCRTSIGSPGTVRRLASVLSRTATWSCSGMPSSIPMTRIGSVEASSVMMSKPSEPTSGSRQRDAVRADLVLELGHPTRREHPRQEPSVHRVDRRVLEHDHARRQLDVGLHDVEDVAAGAREHLPVPERLLDVGVA